MLEKMVRITDELLVSRAEHNDGSLDTLEEVSLHQQKLERIEYINRVCSKLKILHLQDNCIEKIENLSRLRDLEYLNLAMNNIERIENVESLENLKKLDLTLNFIGELSSINALRNNLYLRDLYLMGNPCFEFPHYREYCIATLPQLQFLDGQPIERSERILALQKLEKNSLIILDCERRHNERRKIEKSEAEQEIADKKSEYDDPNLDLDTQRQKFYQSSSKHTPEFRKESQRFREYLDSRDARDRDPFSREDDFFLESKDWKSQFSKNRRLFDDNGKPFNINQADIGFIYDDNSDPGCLLVELQLYKHLNSSLIDVEIEPNFIRVMIKSKIFQLRLLEEIMPDSSTAQRSQTTGHLLLKLPKVTGHIRDHKLMNPALSSGSVPSTKSSPHFLEPTGPSESMDFSKICKQEDSDDEEDVPPLEACID